MQNIQATQASWLHSPWFGIVGFPTFLIPIVLNWGDMYRVAMPLLLLIPSPFSLDGNLISWPPFDI